MKFVATVVALTFAQSASAAIGTNIPTFVAYNAKEIGCAPKEALQTVGEITVEDFNECAKTCAKRTFENSQITKFVHTEKERECRCQGHAVTTTASKGWFKAYCPGEEKMVYEIYPSILKKYALAAPEDDVPEAATGTTGEAAATTEAAAPVKNTDVKPAESKAVTGEAAATTEAAAPAGKENKACPGSTCTASAKPEETKTCSGTVCTASPKPEETKTCNGDSCHVPTLVKTEDYFYGKPSTPKPETPCKGDSCPLPKPVETPEETPDYTPRGSYKPSTPKGDKPSAPKSYNPAPEDDDEDYSYGKPSVPKNYGSEPHGDDDATPTPTYAPKPTKHRKKCAPKPEKAYGYGKKDATKTVSKEVKATDKATEKKDATKIPGSAKGISEGSVEQASSALKLAGSSIVLMSGVALLF